MMRVCDYIADYVYKLGIKDVFMVSGGGMMFLSDGIAKHPHLKFICNHHEQASAMAAVAYAKYTNNLGVAYVTTGCGGTNAITGVLNAWQDNIPCLFVSGQVKKRETTRLSGLKLRQFGVQEADIISIVESITKAAVMIEDPNLIAYHLDRLVWLAKSGRPGPVWLDVPQDVQSAMIDEAALKRFEPEDEPINYKTNPSQTEIAQLTVFVNAAKRPIIIAGQGIRLAGMNKKFKDFVEKYQIPVVAPFLGVGVINTDNKLFIGRLGTKGDRPGNFALQNSDLVIVLGSRLSVSTAAYNYENLAREAKKVIVDIDMEEHRKMKSKVDLFINADLKEFFKIDFNFEKQNTDDWNAKCLDWKAKWPTCLPEYAAINKGVNIYYFIDRLSKLMSSDAVVVSDAGSAFYATTQAINLRDKQRYVTSGGQAEMGFTLPACIGVSAARGRGEVLGITGDGSFQMNIQELQTVFHNKLPIKLFVLNNDGYLSIRNTQLKFFEGRLIGTDSTSGVSFPVLEKIAKAYGIKYQKIRASGEVDKVIKKILSVNAPVICEVKCLRDQEIVPVVMATKRPDGTVCSHPMEDMYPFLERDEFKKNMVIKPLEE